MHFKIDAWIASAMLIVLMAYVLTSYASTVGRMQIVLKGLRSLVSSSVRRMSVKNVPSMRIAQSDTVALVTTV